MAFASPSSDRYKSDLNTTPLIDVMLVLLIMIIVTLPAATHKVALDLLVGPPPESTAPLPVRNVVTIDAAGRIAWNGEGVDRLRLRKLLAASVQMPVEPALDLRPDAGARYEIVDGVIADIKHAGVTKLGLPGTEAYRMF